MYSFDFEYQIIFEETFICSMLSISVLLMFLNINFSRFMDIMLSFSIAVQFEALLN
jgi:hypothetical protein